MNPVLMALPPMADFSQDTWWITTIKAILILVYLLVSVLFALWFERRLIARMQTRLGPNMKGPLGLMQAIYDAMKLLLKEDINVKKADKIVYIVAPMISVFAAFLTMAVIPFGPSVRIPFTNIVTPLQLTDIPVAVLYILAVTSVGVYGIVLGGWSSGSTYPLLGSVRSTAQVISYELAMGMSLVSVFIIAGTMSTSQIVASQETRWWCITLLPAFLIYLVSMIGETNRLPFDLPEAEGELVGGYMTEYSSMKFAWFYLAEYINMLNVSAVATTLFLGGWRAPWPISAIGDGWFNTGWWPIAWFLIKVWLCMFLFVWVRGTLVRLRYDQFMRFGWKVLIPIAVLWIVAVTVVRAIDRFTDISLNRLGMIGLIVIVVALVVILLIPEKKKALRRPAEPVEIDPFAGGFPVPPRPGEKVPASPRAVVTVAATAADSPASGAPQVTAKGEEE